MVLRTHVLLALVATNTIRIWIDFICANVATASFVCFWQPFNLFPGRWLVLVIGDVLFFLDKSACISGFW